MTPIFICSRYNGTIAERRLNLIEHDALCRLAIALGYAPVSPFAGVDRDNPPDDAEGGREAALMRSGALAEMVGRQNGILIAPWYPFTQGMQRDLVKLRNACTLSVGGRIERMYLHDLLPHVPARYRRAVEMRAAGDEAWVREFERAYQLRDCLVVPDDKDGVPATKVIDLDRHMTTLEMTDFLMRGIAPVVTP